MDNDETIRARRRRQGASSGPSGGERAEDHSRQTSGGGGPNLPFGGSGGSGSRGPKLPIWMIVLILIGIVLYNLFFSNNSGSQSPDTGQDNNPVAEQPTQPPALDLPTDTPLAALDQVTPKPTRPSGTPGQKWTVMVYQDADDQILEQDIYMDLNEMERVGSSDRVQIVSQIDRYKGAFTGDGNWTTTRRYHITQDNDLNRVQSELVSDLGELNMGSGSTLVDFVTWAAKTYPADKYVLILSDHGMGWPGGMSDNDPKVQDSNRAPITSALEGDQIYLSEMEKALADSVKKAGIGQFELVGLDACLMSQIEVISALQPYTRYAVLSQETEPALGWAYTGFLQTLTGNPDMSGAELSKRIVTSYIKDDQRINDSQARADFLRQGSPFSAGQVSAAALDQQLEKDVTLSAIDMAQVPSLMDSLNALAYALQSENQDLVARARAYAPAFTNVFGKSNPSPYIDLGGFAQTLKKEGASKKTSAAADQLMTSLRAALVAEKHGQAKAGSTGVTIYFPNSALYRTAVAGPQSYLAIARTFADASLWDDYLTYFYNNVNFDREPKQSAPPSQNRTTRAPGTGQIQVAPITLSGSTAAPGKPVTLTTKITGSNIGYIYFFVGVFDRSGKSIFKADTDYLESSSTQELNGVYYPRWSSNRSFNLSFDWNPTVFQITDGTNTTVALFNPSTFGADAQEAVYTVDGIYHYADGTDRTARLYFRNGVMQHVFGFSDADETGGAREILPTPGDTFTILEKWLDLDASGQVSKEAEQQGVTLTFGDQPFQWKEVYAAKGEYVVGFLVQDLDGNTQEVFTKITVR